MASNDSILIRNGARFTIGLGLVVTLALGACIEEPVPGETTSSTTHTDGPSTSMATTGDGTTGPGTTGPDPMAEPADCDALRDEAACEALAGTDFQCAWFSEAYAVVLDGESCTVGEAIGWCIAATGGESCCVDDVDYQCAAGGTQSDVFVREAEDGTTVVIQDPSLSSTEIGCLGPILWDACDAADSPAACECGCDPGLPP